MGDLTDRIIELMDLFDEGEVTTADKIDRPERALEKQAIDDFMDRNPMAGGGMLVKPSADGSRPGYAGDDGDYIYTRPSGAKRLIFGDKVYGSVAKGDKKGLEELKKKRDKLIADGVVKPRVKYDLETLKNEWRKTLPTKKATTWENFLKTKFPKNSKTPHSIRKKTESDFRKGESNFNPKEEYRVNVKEKQNLKKVEQARKLVEAHKNSDKFLYDKKTIYKKLGFSNVPQVFKKETSTGKVYKSLLNEAIVNEVEKLMPIEQKITNAFDKIVNENIKIYEPKGGSKEKAGIIKKMISDIVSPKGGLEKYQVSSRLINSVLNTHQPYLDIKDNFDYLEQNLARKMKGNTFNEAMDYAKYVRGGLDMKNIEKFSTNYRLPESNVMKFALRSAFNNYKAGNTDSPVRVFNLKADGTPGKEIDFGKLKIDYSTNMKAVDINKIGFTYGNQFFTKKDLRTKGLQSGLFDEVYKLTAKGKMPVPDPNNPSKNITLNKLLQLNKDKLTIGHNDAKGGITKLPFSDLRLEGGKINIALYNAYNKIQNKSLRKSVVNKLQGEFGFLKGDDYERAFIEGERNKANNIANKKINESTLYKQAGRDVITDLGADLLKQKEPFQKELFRVAGMGQKEIETLLASFGDGNCAVTFGPKKRDGGRIGYQTGTPGLNQCIESGIKNFNEGKLKTADQVQDAAKLLRGGRAVVSGLMKYGIVPELAYVGLEAAGRTILGEKPTNALLKSIDSLTFGVTDFTSGIEAEKFGKDADRKLAVDKFRESQAKVNSIQQDISNLETLNTGSQFGYEGDQTEAIQMKNVELEAAKKELEKNYVNPDIVKYIDRKAENIADAERAKSIDSKLRLKSQMEGMPGVADYMDTDQETPRVFPKQPSQMELNLNMLQPLPTDFLDDTTTELFQRSQDFRDQGLKVSTRDLIDYQKALKNMSLSQLAETYNPESIYGSQGVPSQPLAGGGIAKLAGVDQGPPPARGPNPQGLSYLMKRGKNT